MKLKVNKHEAETLEHVIDLHMQGLLDAKGMTIDDPSILTPEDLLDLMSGYDDEIITLSNIRKRLQDGRE